MNSMRILQRIACPFIWAAFFCVSVAIQAGQLTIESQIDSTLSSQHLNMFGDYAELIVIADTYLDVVDTAGSGWDLYLQLESSTWPPDVVFSYQIQQEGWKPLLWNLSGNQPVRIFSSMGDYAQLRLTICINDASVVTLHTGDYELLLNYQLVMTNG